MVTSDRQQTSIPAMQKLARDYQTNGTQCRELAQFLSSPLAAMFWQSQAASSFRDQIGDYTRVLNQLGDSFGRLSSDVAQRAQELELSKNR